MLNDIDKRMLADTTSYATAMRYQAAQHREIDGDVLCFGLAGKAYSLRAVIEHFPKETRFFGFDVFTGLPREQEGVGLHSGFRPGVFNVVQEYRAQMVEEVVEVYEKEFPAENVHIIPGLFSDSLTDELINKHRIESISYLDMDADLYISTSQVLSFFGERSLIKPGTLIGYHDWEENFPDRGEHRAHTEFCEKFGVIMELVWGRGFGGMSNKLFKVA